MSRRFSAPKRQIIPDAKYGDQLVAKFVNSLMLAGKRSTAEKCLYGAFNIIEERFKEEPLDVFKKALDAVKPRVEVKSRRVGGATYQVPVEVRSRWLVQYSRARGEKSMQERLAGELMEASQGRGNAVKKREDTHKMADANKAFAHYRW
jgi:small subunit ribosomal protein S7